MSNIVPISRHIPAQHRAAHVSSCTTSAQNAVGDRRKARSEGSLKRRCGDYATMEFAAQIIAQQMVDQDSVNQRNQLAMPYSTCTKENSGASARLLLSA